MSKGVNRHIKIQTFVAMLQKTTHLKPMKLEYKFLYAPTHYDICYYSMYILIREINYLKD